LGRRIGTGKKTTKKKKLRGGRRKWERVVEVVARGECGLQDLKVKG